MPATPFVCALCRFTQYPGPFSVSASASAESLSASTAGDACPGVGVTHGCVAGYTSTEGDSIFTPCALHPCRSPATPSWARPLCLHDVCPALYLLLKAHQP